MVLVARGFISADCCSSIVVVVVASVSGSGRDHACLYEVVAYVLRRLLNTGARIVGHHKETATSSLLQTPLAPLIWLVCALPSPVPYLSASGALAAADDELLAPSFGPGCA